MYGSVEKPSLDSEGASVPPRPPPVGGKGNDKPRDIDRGQKEQVICQSGLAMVAALIGLLVVVIVYASHGTIGSREETIHAIVEPTLLGKEAPTSTPLMSLSKRGQSIKAIRDDGEMFLEGSQDPYHPIDNPNGYLVMLVAENKLMWREMAHKLETVQASNHPLPEWVFNYGPMGGEDRFKQSMAEMMRHWIHGPIDKDYLRFQAGAGSVLAQISFLLTDPDDGVLTSAPGYPAFAGDFGMYAGAKLHYAESDPENGYVPTQEQLEKAYETSLAAGNPPKILVICQPNNPTGKVYAKEDMARMMQWALDKGMHVVSDEIYALSTFPGYPTSSAADVMWERHPTRERYLGDHVHIVAGLSKDWGLSGFRIGSLFTHNVALLNAMDLIGYYQAVSAYTQHAITEVFQDADFVTWYIEENRRRLHQQYLALQDALDRIDVPLVPSQGAIFAWADFSTYLLDGQTEKDLWLELFDDAKIALTSGESCMANKPGMFRIVYGWPEGGTEAMKELGDRLVKWKANRGDASPTRKLLTGK